MDRIAGALQRKAVRNARLELPLSGQLDQRLRVGAADFGLVLGDPAEAHADDFEAFYQEVVGARRRRPSAEEPEYQDAPAPPQRAQRLIEHIGADRVVDDVDPVARTGQLLDPVAQALA